MKRKNESKFKSFLHKVYQFFTISLYIRVAIEVYVFIILMILSEIKYYIQKDGDDTFGHRKEGEDEQSKGNYVSVSISCLLLILVLGFLVFVFISWKRNKDNIKIEQDCKTRELYNGILQVPQEFIYEQSQEGEDDEGLNVKIVAGGLKEVKIARLYSLIFLLRRLLLILIVVLIPSSSSLFGLKT